MGEAWHGGKFHTPFNDKPADLSTISPLPRCSNLPGLPSETKRGANFQNPFAGSVIEPVIFIIPPMVPDQDQVIAGPQCPAQAAVETHAVAAVVVLRNSSRRVRARTYRRPLQRKHPSGNRHRGTSTWRGSHRERNQSNGCRYIADRSDRRRLSDTPPGHSSASPG